MADLGELKVKVGADISELLTKVDAAKAKLNQLGEGQEGLKAKVKDLTDSLRLNEAQLTKTASRLQGLNTNTKQGAADAALLRKEIGLLGTNSRVLGENLTIAKKQLVETTAQIKVQAVALKEAEAGTNGFAKGATKLYSGLRTLANILPGIGISGIVLLISGPLIDAFESWFASINKVSEATKTLKANQSNLNEVVTNANKEAGKQITDLNLLYQAATNVNLSTRDRLAAVKGLQAEFPDFFKNISKETILNGGAKSAYDALTKSILANAQAKAAVAKITDLESQLLDKQFGIQKVINAVTNESARAQDRLLKGSGGAADVVIKRAEFLASIGERGKKAIDELLKGKGSLEAQIKFLTDYVGLANAAKAVETDIKPVKNVSKTKADIETINDVLEKLRIQIDFLNRKEIVLKTNEAAAKISAIESTIEHLLQKFKLNGDNAIIINLEARIKDIQLTEQFKKVFNPKTPIKVPLDIQFEMLKGTDPFPPGAFDEQILRDQIREKSKKLNIKIDINGLFITSGTSLPALQKTLDKAENQIQDFNSRISSVLNDLNASILEGLGNAIGNAFNGQGDAIKGLFDTIFSTLGSALQQLGKIAIETGVGIKAIKTAFKSLNPLVAIAAGVGLIALGTIIKNSIGNVKGFATGGEIKGKGTGTSDSILARVSKGEYIIKADTVKKFGVGFFDKINKGSKPINYEDFINGRAYPRFAAGGFISPNVIKANQLPGNISALSIGGGQRIEVVGEFLLKGTTAVALVKRGNDQIRRNS